MILILSYDSKFNCGPRAEKNSIGNQSRSESRQESRIGSYPILFILLDLFIINKMKIFVDDDCMQ